MDLYILPTPGPSTVYCSEKSVIMAAEVQSFLPPAASGGEKITSVNHNDVLMGRGTGPNEFIGNQRFRSIVAQHKEEYKTAPKNHEGKTKIAREIVTQIHALGGRFLKPTGIDTPANVVVERAVWYEVEERVALEKCRQALRDLWKKRMSPEGNDGRHINDLTIPAVTMPQSSAGLRTGMVAVAPQSLGRVEGDSTSLPILPGNLMHMLPLLLAENWVPRVVDLDERLLAFRAGPCVFHEPFILSQPMARNPVLFYQLNSSVQNQHGITVPSAANTSHGSLQGHYGSVNSDAIDTYMRCLASIHLSSRLQSAMPPTDFVSPEPRQSWRRLNAKGEAVADQTDSGCTATALNPSMSEDHVTAAAPDNDMSEFLQPVFEQDSDIPQFTEEQEEIERATLTDEEKAAALSDLFGRCCGISTHKNKKARRDLDKNAIEFLVQQMRLEIERIPEDRKRALVEAQSKCGAEEFSNARLEHFLRCEGMNVKLGAQRFVSYWENRLELFGPEKYVLRMTLTEALRDDLVALETCACRLLPHLDTSGRQLLLAVPSNHTREGYTSESMLRALWYVTEVMAQENTDVRRGFVIIVWCKALTIWDYDRILYKRMNYFYTNCWPVQRKASHGCCAHWIVTKVIKPIAFAWMDKHARSRTLFHDVSESQLPDVLTEYGIPKERLPIEMGGTLLLDQAAWIASRRATELGEI